MNNKAHMMAPISFCLAVSQASIYNSEPQIKG